MFRRAVEYDIAYASNLVPSLKGIELLESILANFRDIPSEEMEPLANQQKTRLSSEERLSRS